jgi:hypothetical protein
MGTHCNSKIHIIYGTRISKEVVKLKNKRGGQGVNRSLTPKLLPHSKVYMGRKIADNYLSQGVVSNKRVKSDSGGCGCGKPKQVGSKNK